MDTCYITINSTIISTSTIENFINRFPDKVINIGDKKIYSKSLYEYNSFEFYFPFIGSFAETSEFIKEFIKENIEALNKLRLIDDDLYISLRFVVELNKESTPDTFFDSEIINLLASINATLDIDLYYE